jgi:hypothetical protein
MHTQPLLEGRAVFLEDTKREPSQTLAIALQDTTPPVRVAKRVQTKPAGLLAHVEAERCIEAFSLAQIGNAEHELVNRMDRGACFRVVSHI